MKCINMKVAVVLFFTTNFLSINPGLVKENKTNLFNEEASIKKFEACPDLLKMVRNNSLSEYIIDCKMQSTKSNTFQTEVLQHACLVVKNMFSVMCKQKFNGSSLDLLGRNNANDICPFDFSHLKRLDLGNVFKNHESVKTLTHAGRCKDVCYFELYSSRPQCVLLSKFNEYFKTQIQVPQSNSDMSPVHPKVVDPSTHNISETPASQSSKKENLFDKSLAKIPITNIRSEILTSQLVTAASKESVTKIFKKEKKAEKPETAEEEINSTEKTETPQGTDINDKPKNGDFLNKDNFQKMDDSLLDKTVLSQESDSQKIQNFEDKESPYIKEKEAYIGEGFPRAEDSHFFFYFIMMSSLVVIGYLAFHNKNKILAYALEGSSNRRSRRRPNPARYRKLETNLEEAISSNATNSATSSVVY